MMYTVRFEDRSTDDLINIKAYVLDPDGGPDAEPIMIHGYEIGRTDRAVPEALRLDRDAWLRTSALEKLIGVVDRHHGKKED